MDVLTLIAGLVLVVGALALILYPLWRHTRPDAVFRTDQTQQMLENFEARYQAALAAVKDLILDYEMGKVSKEDYQPLLSKAKLEAAQLRQQIDRLSRQTTAEIEPTLETEIEALVAELKSNRSADGNEALLQAIDAEIELLKQTKRAKSACPNCGKRAQDDDAFCSGCGQPLADLGGELEPDEHSCPQCGGEVQPDDAYCAQCGAALAAAIKRQEREEATL